MARLARRLALASLIVVGIVFALGPRVVYAYREFRCPDGEGAAPVAVVPVYECRPQPRDGAGWPQVAPTQHDLGVYLVNVHVRVFHVDFLSDVHEWLAFGFPVS